MRSTLQHQLCTRRSHLNGYSPFAVATATLLLLAATATTTLAVTCARPQKVLTSQCNTLCEPYHPCVIIDNALDLEWTCGSEPLSNLSTCVARIVDPCHYECFAVDKARPQNYTTFSFFVPFGAWRSKQDRAQASSSAAAEWTQQVAALTAVALNDSVSWKSNNNVQRIDWLELPTTCTDVVLVGGTSEQSLKGKVASVALAADMLRNNTFVTTVRLANLDLEDAAPTLAALLPASQLTTLTLANTLLAAVPADLKSLKQLLSLDLQWNYITTVAASDSLASLLHLNLHDNKISNFEAAMPKLQTLNLSANALTEIPSVIFEMQSLTALSLDGNPLVSPTLSVSQHAFLEKLATLQLPVFKSAPACDASKQTQLSGVTVCVLDDLAMKKKSSGGASSSSDASSSSSPATLIGAIVGGVVVLAVIVFGIIAWRRKRSSSSSSGDSKGGPADAYADERTPTGMTVSDSKHRTQYATGSGFASREGGADSSNAKSSSSAVSGNGNGATFLSVWNDPELLSVQLRFDDIEDIKPIGTGAYGVVWLVRYRQSQLLAAKRLRPGETDRARTQAFINEIKLVAKLEHPNIVRFVGAAWTVESDLQALFEFMDGGDLKSYLLEAETPRHWTQEKLQIAADIAEALVYVHSFTPPLVHRDLKARNVLLSSRELRAKLTDFGVSRYQSEYQTMTAGVGTARWLAPEVISGDGDYGAPADMYSFGVVLSEIDTHESPFTDARSATGNQLSEIAVLQMVARGDLAPSFSHACPETIRALAMRCIAFEAAQRPSAVEVAYQLRTIQRNLYASL